MRKVTLEIIIPDSVPGAGPEDLRIPAGAHYGMEVDCEGGNITFHDSENPETDKLKTSANRMDMRGIEAMLIWMNLRWCEACKENGVKTTEKGPMEGPPSVADSIPDFKLEMF